MNIFGFSNKLAGLKEKLKENATFFDRIARQTSRPPHSNSSEFWLSTLNIERGTLNGLGLRCSLGHTPHDNF
jgi:hypothetical protein